MNVDSLKHSIFILLGFLVMLIMVVVNYESKTKELTGSEDAQVYSTLDIEDIASESKEDNYINDKGIVTYNVGDLSDSDIEEIFSGYLEDRKSIEYSEPEYEFEKDDDSFAKYDPNWFSLIEEYITEEEEESIESECTEETSTMAEVEPDPEPDPIKNIIIDTDFASDADDVLAIRLAMCFQDKGMLDIKGIALSTSYSRSPSAVHALCKADGYGSIPVAMDTMGGGTHVHTEYVNVMYELPKDVDTYEQPVEMYRRILASSEEKVNIITLGFLQNIQHLLMSGADQFSMLSGTELVAQKVDKIYIVGGSDDKRPSFNFCWTGEKIIEAAQYVTKNSPVPIVYLPTDLSADTFCGGFYKSEDSKSKDIVTKALISNKQEYGVVAWDVFSMWCAVQDIHGKLDDYEINKEYGNFYVSHTGATEWSNNDACPHSRLTKSRSGGEYNAYLNGMLHEKFVSMYNLQ